MSGADGATEPGIDAVLLAQPPAFSEPDAAADGARGVRHRRGRRRGTWAANGTRPSCCWTRAGEGLAILKVSNPAEDPATLDMEALVAFHAVRTDPGLPVAQPRRSPGARDRLRCRRLPGALGARRRRALAARLRPAARSSPAGPAHAGRPGPGRLGRDDGPARARAAQLHPPQRDPHAAVGRPARRHGPPDAGVHPGPGDPAHRRGGARPVRGQRPAALVRSCARRSSTATSPRTTCSPTTTG